MGLFGHYCHPISADRRAWSEPNQVCDMLTSLCCKWWISAAFYRSNGLDKAIIETLHVRTALKNGSFLRLLSSYRLITEHEVDEMRYQVSWHLLAAKGVSDLRFIGPTVRSRLSSKPYMAEPLWKIILFGDYCHPIGWPPFMMWNKWGLWYADILLMQMMDKPWCLKFQRFLHGYHRNLTW